MYSKSSNGDIVAGWVTGLTTEPQQAEAGPGDEVKMSKETQSKVAALRYSSKAFWYSLICVKEHSRVLLDGGEPTLIHELELIR